MGSVNLVQRRRLLLARVNLKKKKKKKKNKSLHSKVHVCHGHDMDAP